MMIHTWFKDSVYGVVAAVYLLGWGTFCLLLPDQVTWLNTAPLFLYSALCLAAAMYAIRYLQQRLEKLSLADPDLNLYNERFFKSALNLEFNRSNRHDLPLSLVVFSFDDLRETADQLGRDATDINKLFVQTVSTTIRSSDILSALEKGKYSLLLPNTDVDGAKVAASRLKAEISSELKKMRLGQRTSVPFGICGTTEGVKSSDELFAGSVQAYSVAKGSPRNKIVSCGEACR